MTPREFEIMSGKAQAKKWKNTIRVCKSDGSPGMTMLDWLMKMGLERPRGAVAINPNDPVSQS